MAAIKHVAGEFYFHAYFDDEGGKVEIEQYGLRSIRKGRAFFTIKLDGLTWGKRSKKAGDFGWLTRIPAWCRTSERVGSDAARRYAKTKAAAIRAALAAERAGRAYWKDDAEFLAGIDRGIAALQTRLKRTKT